MIDLLRRHPRVANLDQTIAAAQKWLDRIIFVAFAKDRGLLPRRLLESTANLAVPGLSSWQGFQALFRAIRRGDSRCGVEWYNGSLFGFDPLLDHHEFHLDPLDPRWEANGSEEGGEIETLADDEPPSPETNGDASEEDADDTDHWSRVFASIGRYDFEAEVLERVERRLLTSFGGGAVDRGEPLGTILTNWPSLSFAQLGRALWKRFTRPRASKPGATPPWPISGSRITTTKGGSVARRRRRWLKSRRRLTNESPGCLV